MTNKAFLETQENNMKIILALFCCFFWGCGEGVPPLSPLGPEDTILAFGDSLTFGTGANEANSYPVLLESLIGLNVVRSGNPGEVSAQGVRRLPALLEEHNPKLILLCYGGNDFLQKVNKEKTIANIKTMIDLAKKNNTEVVLLAVPSPGVFISPAPFYQEIADEYKIPCENDIISDVLSKGTLKSDMIHPNAKGYKKIAEALQDLLYKAQAISISN